MWLFAPGHEERKVEKALASLEAEGDARPDLVILDWEDAVVHNLEAFARAIAGTAPYPFTMEEMVHNIEVLEAIALSSEDRRTVEISELA